MRSPPACSEKIVCLLRGCLGSLFCRRVSFSYGWHHYPSPRMERVRRDVDVWFVVMGFACGPHAETCAGDMGRVCGLPSGQHSFWVFWGIFIMRIHTKGC